MVKETQIQESTRRQVAVNRAAAREIGAGIDQMTRDVGAAVRKQHAAIGAQVRANADFAREFWG